MQQPAQCLLRTSMGSLTPTTIMIHTREFIAHSTAAIYHTDTGKVTGPDISVSPQHKSTL